MDVRAFIEKHEGVRTHVYKDSLGIPTVGVGFNLHRPDARQRLTDAGADYDAVLSGQASLTMDQVNSLLDADIADCVADLKTLFPNWDSMPDGVQAVLTDLRFNLGPTRLRGFPNTLTCFQNGDWKAAAQHLSVSLWAKQVGVRATEDVNLLLSA